MLNLTREDVMNFSVFEKLFSYNSEISISSRKSKILFSLEQKRIFLYSDN